MNFSGERISEQSKGHSSRITEVFRKNRACGKKGLIAFVNAGDPDMAATRQIIHILEYNRVDIVELCVPFPNSFTDGSVILKSHQRALSNNTTLHDTLDMVVGLRRESSIPLVLLADYSHTVKPMGMAAFLTASREAGIEGTLVHGLPPLLSAEYQALAAVLNLTPILGLYPVSVAKRRAEIYSVAKGYLYLATRFGRSGVKSFVGSESIRHYLTQVRLETSMPLAAGLGVNTRDDLRFLYETGIDAVILGSALISIIEENLENRKKMLLEINLFLQRIYFGHWFFC